jgi:ACS family D-galactonate transporter-like MFS transporter
MQPTRARFGILALISAATMLNYLDRSVLGVAKPALTAELHIGPEVMGLIFSAFSWTYALAQVPGGFVLDKFGTRITYGLSLFLWSAATALHGLASGVAGLLGARLALGLAESPCFPANSRVLASWFPQGERARANSVYAVGQYIGLGLLIPGPPPRRPAAELADPQLIRAPHRLGRGCTGRPVKYEVTKGSAASWSSGSPMDTRNS